MGPDAVRWAERKPKQWRPPRCRNEGLRGGAAITLKGRDGLRLSPGYRSITLMVLSSGLYWYLVTRSSFCDSKRTTRARPPVMFRVL